MTGLGCKTITGFAILCLCSFKGSQESLRKHGLKPSAFRRLLEKSRRKVVLLTPARDGEGEEQSDSRWLWRETSYAVREEDKAQA